MWSIQVTLTLTYNGKPEGLVHGIPRPVPANEERKRSADQVPERESSLLTAYWSGSTDVFGVPASRHGSLNLLFQVALYLPS